ncbi:PAS domain-containing sensor histidine kinase, partial [Pseudomonas sp. MWU13-2625]
MVLKNLIKAKTGQPEPLTDYERLARPGLPAGPEALPPVGMALDRQALPIAFVKPAA